MAQFIRRCIAALFILAGLPASAQPSPLTLAEAQRLAVARSQLLVANDAALAATRDMAVAAGQLPDPVLKLEAENVPLSGPERFSLSRDFMTMGRIGLMQEFTRSDKRRLKVERVERDGERIRAEREMAVAEIQRETAAAWIDATYKFAMLELLKAQSSEVQMQVDAAELAFRSGRGSQAEIFAARSGLANLWDRQRQTERQAGNARLMLARWAGPEIAQRPLAVSVDWRDAAIEKVAQAEHLRRHPRLVILEAQLRAAETEARQAQANTRADWTLEAIYGRRGSAYSDMVSIGVSIPLQLDRDNRQNRELAAKLAAVAEARAKLEDAVRAEEATTRVLLNDWESGKQRLDQLTAELLPAARNRMEAAQAAYRAGKGELGTALVARGEEIEARLQLLALEAEVAKLWAQLKFLIPDTAASH